MEKRVLLAIVLAFTVLYAWQALFVKPVPKPAAGAPATTSAAASGAGTSTPAPALTPAAAPPAAATPPPSAATALVSDSSERDVRVETQDVIAIFTNRGARLK